MPDSYTYKSSGANSQGNHWCSRDCPCGDSKPKSYNYSNRDGSSNPRGSTHNNTGTGSAAYTSPSSGSTRKK